MSFDPSTFALRPTAPTTTGAIPLVASTVTATALREAGARWLKRHDSFADGKADACFDMADKLERFGSFVSDKQAGFAEKLIAWSLPRATAATPQEQRATEPKSYPVTLPKLFDLMQRLAKLRFNGLTIARKNGDSLCWVKLDGIDKVVGKIENGVLVIFTGRLANTMGADVLRDLLIAIEADPERAAVLHGKASGNCSVCGRDLTDPESIEAGIGPICLGKYFR